MVDLCLVSQRDVNYTVSLPAFVIEVLKMYRNISVQEYEDQRVTPGQCSTEVIDGQKYLLKLHPTQTVSCNLHTRTVRCRLSLSNACPVFSSDGPERVLAYGRHYYQHASHGEAPTYPYPRRRARQGHPHPHPCRSRRGRRYHYH